MVKTCKKCNIEKNVTEFYFDSRRNAPISPCKECRISKATTNSYTWRQSNPEKVKKSNHKGKLKRMYGLTPENLVTLWTSQDCSCAICKRPISLSAANKASKPHIDHCHVTGVVRGLLCLTCNTGLGMFGDSDNLLDAARKYLLRTNTSALGKNISDSDTVKSDFVIH